jgi:hypothetical protein
MNKKDKVAQLLSKIQDQTDELLEAEGVELLTPEEVVILATELATSLTVTTTEYSYPLGKVDRDRVTFALGDDYEVPLMGDVYYEET